MRIVRGDKLSRDLREAVLRRYVHRWTVENATQTYGGRCPACEQTGGFPYVTGQALPDGPKVHTRESWHAYHKPLTTDDAWLRAHAFRVTKRGTLDERQAFALPALEATT